jgi:hypothetical protein
MSGAKEHGGKNEGAVAVRKDIRDVLPHHIVETREHRCPHSPVTAQPDTPDIFDSEPSYLKHKK